MGTATRRNRILVVTDDVDEGAHARTILTRAGFAVDLVGNADVVIDQVEAGRPELIVMDTRTPRLADWPILPELARLPACPPIVVLSSACMAAQTLGVINAAAAAHLAKPIEPEMLVGRCKRLLSGRS